MAAITEDYVSFETAKLLKEKGFSENTEHEIWYVIKQFSTGCHWNSCTYKVGDITREYNDGCCIPMPTLQMAMKWLREVHKIGIFPSTYTFTIGYGTEKHHPYGTAIINLVTYELITNDIMPRNSYEQACEAAIKYCLENLI